MASHRKRKQGKISRDCVKATLKKSTKLLCDNLRIDSMLLGLLSEDVVELDDVTRINKKDTDTEKVAALLGILVKASVSAYYIFMVKLEEIRSDLYKDVKKNEEDIWKGIQEKESGASSSKKARSKKTGGKKAHKTKKTTSAAAGPPDDDDSPIVTTNIKGNDNVVTVCQHGNQTTHAQTSGTSSSKHSSHQEPPSSSSSSLPTTSDGSEKITEDDCTLIPQELGMAQLKNLYPKLGLKKTRVEKEEASVTIDNADLKARSVLLYWLQANGRKATRIRVLLGLKACGDSENEIEALQSRWNIHNASLL